MLPLMWASLSPRASAPQLFLSKAAPQVEVDMDVCQAGEPTFGDFLRANGAGNLLASFEGAPAPAAASLQQVSNSSNTMVDCLTCLGRSRYG